MQGTVSVSVLSWVRDLIIIILIVPKWKTIQMKKTFFALDPGMRNSLQMKAFAKLRTFLQLNILSILDVLSEHLSGGGGASPDMSACLRTLGTPR